MGTYKAHIFKERSVGDREEVKLKIFGPDGEPIELGSGGTVERVWGEIQGTGLVPVGESVPMQIHAVLGGQGEGIPDPEANGTEMAFPPGVYFAKLVAGDLPDPADNVYGSFLNLEGSDDQSDPGYINVVSGAQENPWQILQVHGGLWTLLGSHSNENDPQHLSFVLSFIRIYVL